MIQKLYLHTHKYISSLWIKISFLKLVFNKFNNCLVIINNLKICTLVDKKLILMKVKSFILLIMMLTLLERYFE